MRNIIINSLYNMPGLAKYELIAEIMNYESDLNLTISNVQEVFASVKSDDTYSLFAVTINENIAYHKFDMTIRDIIVTYLMAGSPGGYEEGNPLFTAHADALIMALQTDAFVRSDTYSSGTYSQLLGVINNSLDPTTTFGKYMKG